MLHHVPKMLMFRSHLERLLSLLKLLPLRHQRRFRTVQSNCIQLSSQILPNFQPTNKRFKRSNAIFNTGIVLGLEFLTSFDLSQSLCFCFFCCFFGCQFFCLFLFAFSLESLGFQFGLVVSLAGTTFVGAGPSSGLWTGWWWFVGRAFAATSGR